MRINDNGFTEKVATPSTPAPAAGKVASTKTATETAPVSTGAGDNLELSGFTARLNSGLATDTSTRAANVSKISNAVNSGTFQVDTAAVTRSIVAEGLQGKR